MVILVSIILLQGTIMGATPESGKFGLGIQLTSPHYGLSGIYNHSEEISFQGVIGTGYWGSIGGRILYRFEKKEFYNLYGYGALGLYTQGYSNYYFSSGFSLGAGAGIEYNWKGLSEDLPPVFTNLEAGLSSVYPHINIGVGFHYYFNISD